MYAYGKSLTIVSSIEQEVVSEGDAEVSRRILTNLVPVPISEPLNCAKALGTRLDFDYLFWTALYQF
jgi:hypothetical protein